MKRSYFSLFQILAVVIYLLSIIVVLPLLNSKVLEFMPDEALHSRIQPIMSYWMVIGGAGVTILNCWFLSICSKMKETAKFSDCFSTWGRRRIAQEPDQYFTPEDYRQYAFFWKMSYVFMGLAAFFLFWLSR